MALVPAHPGTAAPQVAAEAADGGGRRVPAAPADTGVRLGRLEWLFLSCPDIDPQTREIVVRRFREGADIGYRGTGPERFTANNRSALQRKSAVSAAIAREVRDGFTRGPFRTPPLTGFRVNALSARDKPNGEVRLILDLSQPTGSAVNDGIDPEQFRLTYTSVDEATRLIYAVGGQGALLFKADVKNAFKLIPVRPEQWRLLGFCWLGAFYFQVCLPFGGRSSPRIFDDFAVCLLKLLQSTADDVFVRHYLDDFLGVGPRGSSGASAAYSCINAICQEVGVPLAAGKCSPPATRMELLGVVLDTTDMSISLPDHNWPTYLRRCGNF